MVYWKIDDETIRCLINKDEIGEMGYDLMSLARDGDLLRDFLQTIVEESHNHVVWNTENGVQHFVARALPAGQFLLTISCNFNQPSMDMPNHPPKDVQTMDPETSNEENSSQQAMSSYEDVMQEEPLAQDRQNEAEKDNRKASNAKAGKDEIFPAQRIIFSTLAQLVELCSMLDRPFYYPSRLYKYKDEYHLLVNFEQGDSKVNIISFVIAAEEYGGRAEYQGYSSYFLKEHGDLLIAEDAIEILKGFK